MIAPEDHRARRIITVLAGLVIAGLFAGALLWWPELRRTITTTLGALHDAGDDGLQATFVDPAQLAGTTITEDVARQFYTQLERPTNRMMYDPVATIVLRPDRTQSFDWPEHPGGKVTFRTNNLGLREDRPTAVAKSGPRILVLGDSHTEGLVNNDENVAHVLERLLQPQAQAAGATSFEVLDAAVGGTGPHEYLGQLRKHLDLRPDIVIVILYTGNDFSNALMISDFLTKRTIKPRDAAYRALLDSAGERWPKLLPQGFNQACQFRYWSGDDDVALAVTLDDLLQINQLCSSLGATLLTVLLPSLPDVQPDTDRATLDALMAALQLTPDELGINQRLAHRLAAALAEHGLRCLDPAPAMAAATTPLYWRTDHHLAIAGHALLAQLIHDNLLELLPGLDWHDGAAAGATGADAPAAGTPAGDVK